MKLLLTFLFLAGVLLGADGLPNQPYLYVQGEAEVSQPADLVLLRFRLSALQPEQAEANKRVQAQANQVFALLKATGVPESDIVASDLFSDTEYDRAGGPIIPGLDTEGDSGQRPPKLLGYRVSRPFEVKVRDLKTFPKLVTDLLELKVERFDRISEGLSTEKKLSDEVWQKAVDDARRRADLLAKAAGMKVDGVYAISPSTIPAISREMLDEENSRSYPLSGAAPAGVDAAKYVLRPVKVTQTIHILYLISPAK